MANEIFQFKTNPLDAKDNLSPISNEAIMAMSIPELLAFQNKLVSVRHRVRYDTAVWEKVVVTPEHAKSVFRRGLNQSDTYATSDTEIKKTRVHTNMTKDGEFEQGSLVIIKDISVVIMMFSGLPTTAAKGVISNAKATFPSYIDPALCLYAIANQFEIAYKEGESEIFKGLLSEFPQNTGVSGFLGASSGGVAQNALMQRENIPNPRVLKGGDDFSVDIRPLTNFDLTNATGINQELVIKVELSTIELVTQKI